MLGLGSVRAYWYATLAFTVLRLVFNAAGVAKHVGRRAEFERRVELV